MDLPVVIAKAEKQPVLVSKQSKAGDPVHLNPAEYPDVRRTIAEPGLSLYRNQPGAEWCMMVHDGAKLGEVGQAIRYAGMQPGKLLLFP